MAKLRYFFRKEAFFSFFFVTLRTIDSYDEKVLIKTIILLLTLTAMLLMSCEEQQIAHQKEEVDSLMNAAYQSRNYELILSLADQHQQD